MKGLKNKEGKEEPWKRGRKRWTLKMERKSHGREGRKKGINNKERNELSLHLFRLGLSSLPWFFPSFFIVQAFLLWSPALAVQALPLAHNVEWCLRASTASPSLHPQSGAQVGFWKMSAEGVGSRVIRANNFGLGPPLLTNSGAPRWFST